MVVRGFCAECLPLSLLPVSLLGKQVLFLFPFHCWASRETSVKGERNPLQREALHKDVHNFHHPFHCWAPSHPSPPVSLLGHTLGPGPGVLLFSTFRDSCDVRKYLRVLFRFFIRNPDPGRCRNTLRINPNHRGNRRGKHKKPATESTRAQGKGESEELSLLIRTVHPHYSQLSEKPR